MIDPSRALLLGYGLIFAQHVVTSSSFRRPFAWLAAAVALRSLRSSLVATLQGLHPVLGK
jgi:hypothetical protein